MYEPPNGYCYHGVHLKYGTPIVYDELKRTLESWAETVGKGFYVVGAVIAFDEELDFLDVFEALCEDQVIGAFMLNWRPCVPASNETDESTINAIAAGEYDDYIIRTAETIKAFTYPIFVRFGYEMNGDWVGWGHDVETFKTAWKRIVDLFRSVGATNAAWVFNPDKGPRDQYPQWYTNRAPWKDYYPGDDYVDWTSCSMYSYGLNHIIDFDLWMTWTEQVEFAVAHGKPFMFGELGMDSYYGGGMTPEEQISFLAQAFDFMNRNNRVKAFVWYDLPFVYNDPERLNVYQLKIANPRYLSTKPTPIPPIIPILLGAFLLWLATRK